MRNKLVMFLAMVVVMGIATNVWSQQATTDTPFQVRYFANLNVGDSFINITNSGANGAPLITGAAGDICANVYVFAPDEQMVSCCACPVSPNGLRTLSARNDLISNTLTPAVPTSIVVKLIATLNGPGGSGGSCNAASVGTSGGPLVPGLLAWGTTIHPQVTTTSTPNTSSNCTKYCKGAYPQYAGWCQQNCKPVTTTTTSYVTTESSFSPATLSAGELARINLLCGVIQGNGSGFGICRSCQEGAMAPAK